mmetsp:Transcript_11740/g.28095  ORF Transcript_11740/g.28095 Transcript_11740/m.28095 type:complete len:426 (+) Transcript_11740:44-1321(+)
MSGGRISTISSTMSVGSKVKSDKIEAEVQLQGVELSQNMFVLKNLRKFHEYDKNGRGTISIPDMKAVLRTTTVGLTERDLRTVLKEVDADGDGSVSFPEYLRLAQKLEKMQNKSKAGKTSRIPRSYLEPTALKQYTDLFESAAGEEGAISFSLLQDFLQQHNMTISDERLKSIMKEVDDDESGRLELDEFLILLIKALGIKRRKVGPDHLPAAHLRQEGWALGELRKIGYDCAALREAGFSAADLMDVCTARELLLGGVPVSELLSAGWDCRHAREAGFRIADLAAAGATVRNMRTAGFTDVASVVALRKLRVQAWKMKLGGFTLSDLRNGGYSSAELRLAGFTSASIAALEKLQNHLKNRSPLNRQNTPELRQAAEKKYLEANLDKVPLHEKGLQSLQEQLEQAPVPVAAASAHIETPEAHAET